MPEPIFEHNSTTGGRMALFHSRTTARGLVLATQHDLVELPPEAVQSLISLILQQEDPRDLLREVDKSARELDEARGEVRDLRDEAQDLRATLAEVRKQREEQGDEVRGLRDELKQVTDQRDSWKAEAEAKRSVAEQAGERIKELGEELDQTRIRRDNYRAAAEQAAGDVNELETERDEIRDQAEKLADHLDRANEKIDNLEAVPLDPSQLQRVSALQAARVSILEAGSGGVFSKSVAEKINSYAALLSTAQFITSGKIDYVVGEGEFIERDGIGVRVPAELGSGDLVGEKPLAATTATYGNGWQSGIEDVIAWIEDHMHRDHSFYVVESGTDSLYNREGFVEKIRETFADPAGDGEVTRRNSSWLAGWAEGFENAADWIEDHRNIPGMVAELRKAAKEGYPKDEDPVGPGGIAPVSNEELETNFGITRTMEDGSND